MIAQTLFTGWHFMRWFRLGLGIFIAIQAFQQYDALLGFFSAFFLVQAATNTGCCGANGCAVPSAKSNQDKIEKTEFTEIK